MSTREKYAPPPETFPKKGSSANGTDTAYSVEARMAYPEPRQIAGVLLGLQWRKIEFTPAQGGVPVDERMFPFNRTLGLLSYQAAQALRWWFIAEAAKSFDHMCLETRLIEHEVTFSYSDEQTRPCEPVGGDGAQPHLRPAPSLTTALQETKP